MSAVVNFTFAGRNLYTPPAGNKANFTWEAQHPPSSVYASGFDAALWGDAHPILRYRNVLAAGINSLQFGSPAVRLQKQYVNVVGQAYTSVPAPYIYNRLTYVRPTGGKYSTYGTAYAYNRNRYVYATGAKFGSFGTQIVQNRDIHPTGWKEVSRFGNATAYNKTVKIYPPGTIRTIFGTGTHVDLHKFTIPGLIHTKWGTTFVYNELQRLLPNLGVQTKFGSPWVSNKRRYVHAYHPTPFRLLPNGTYGYAPLPDEYFGNPITTHKSITPKLGLQTKWGTLKIMATTQLVYPFGVFDKLMGNKTVVETFHRSVRAAGFVAGSVTAPTMSPLTLKPTPFIATRWTYGYPRVGGTKVVGVTLGHTMRMGTPFASYTPRYIHPPSIVLTTRFGAPPYGVMHTFLQHIEPAGIDSAIWGPEEWDYRDNMHVLQNTRSSVGGGEMSAFGKPTAADGARWAWMNTRLSRIRISQ